MGQALGNSDEELVGHRFGQLAGLIAFALVLGRLGRLLLTGPGTPQWQLILLASAFLGGIVWWLIRQVISNRILSVALFSLGGLVLFLRISVADTLIAGVLPTSKTPEVLGSVLENSIAVIRHGVPPILPTEGVIAILAIVVWVVGALYTWGYVGGPAIAMVLPSIVLYLQFAIFDRASAGLGWMLASGLMLALAASTLALERKRDVGRARDNEGRPKAARSMAAAIIMAGFVGVVAIAAANSASGVVSEYGNVPWRSGGSDYGLGGASFRLDRFASMQQKLISRDNLPVFRVTYDAGSPDVSQVYWTLETLDSFNGQKWGRSTGGDVRKFEPGRGLGPVSNSYQGTTTEWTHLVESTGLVGLIAPSGGVPIDILPVDHVDAIDPREFSYLSDSALYLPAELRKDDVYQVTALYPAMNRDLGALATGEDGQLSPLFSNASDADRFRHPAAPPPNADITAPPDLESFIELPERLPVGVRNIAHEVTLDATTDYEKAWMLQYWFRDSEEFIYDVNVSSGHSSLDLDDWLNDSSRPNYRTGYCEQFATSMAVLGRQLGIPSRVVLGFTPGTPKVDGNVKYVEVRDTNAHAWVEMWMDGFGWVQFDPTPRGDTQPTSLTAGFDPALYAPERPPIEIAPPDPNASNPLGPDFTEETAASSQGGTRWWLIALVAIPLVVGLVPLIKRIRHRRRLKAIRHGDITAAWDELVDQLTDLGKPVPASKTPVEFARETDPALLPIAVGYSSTIYGGREHLGQELHLHGIDGWVQNNFDGVERFRAAVNPKSLLNRD